MEWFDLWASAWWAANKTALAKSLGVFFGLWWLYSRKKKK